MATAEAELRGQLLIGHVCPLQLGFDEALHPFDELREHGFEETKVSVANKLSRGTFPGNVLAGTCILIAVAVTPAIYFDSGLQQSRNYQNSVSGGKTTDPQRGDHDPGAASPASQQSPHDNQTPPTIQPRAVRP